MIREGRRKGKLKIKVEQRKQESFIYNELYTAVSLKRLVVDLKTPWKFFFRNVQFSSKMVCVSLTVARFILSSTLFPSHWPNSFRITRGLDMGIIIPATALFYHEFVRFTDELALPFQSYLQIIPASFFIFLKSIEVRFNFIFIGTHLRCALSTANLFDHVVGILWFDNIYK